MRDMPVNGEGKYIYCLIRCDGERDFAVSGINGGQVYTISYKDLAAVVSDSIFRHEFTPRSLKAHQMVIEEVMKDFTVLPVGFGCIARDAGQIQDKVLKAKFDYLHKMLKQMENKVELVLKALWKDEQATSQLASNSRIRRLQQKIASRPPGTARQEQIELGELVKAELSKRREKETKEMLAPLEALAVDRRLHNVTTPTMIFNASFLVEKEREPEFDNAVNELGERYRDEVKFIYVGPLPPYDFVDMAIRL